MTSTPITLMPPVVGRVHRGECKALRRPSGGNLERALCRPGDPVRLLWIREPFHLPTRFDAYAPLAAASLGARPIFSEDERCVSNADIGARRVAYTLPRQWHRVHLRVTDFFLEPLQNISDAEIAAEGWPDRASYAIAWDRALQVGGRAPEQMWKSNPKALVIRFEFVASPVPELELAA